MPRLVLYMGCVPSKALSEDKPLFSSYCDRIVWDVLVICDYSSCTCVVLINWTPSCSHHVVSVNDYYFYCLLLLSGDVVLNPCPAKFPCVVRHFPVSSDQCTLSCDECGLWCHCKCCSVNKAQYESFQVQFDFAWTCSSCLSKNLPFHSFKFA